jgi:hypothetical protein
LTGLILVSEKNELGGKGTDLSAHYQLSPLISESYLKNAGGRCYKKLLYPSHESSALTSQKKQSHWWQVAQATNALVKKQV